MDSKIITVRTDAELSDMLDKLAEKMNVSRSVLVQQAIENLVEEVTARGYVIPPYEGDEIQQRLRLGHLRRNFRGQGKPFFSLDTSENPKAGNERE